MAAVLLTLTLALPALAGERLPAGRARMPALETCSEEEDGRVRLPGTDTCLAIGGTVELNVVAAAPVPRAVPLWTTSVLPRFAIESTSDTDWGELRTLSRVTFSESSLGGSAVVPDYLFVSLGAADEGLLQAGLTDSVFGFYNSAANALTLRGPGVSSTMLRWARLPETGWGWTAAVENNPSNIRQSLLDPAFQAIVAPGADAPPRVPNLSGALRWAGDWGKVQVAGTVGQLRLANPNATLGRAALLLGLELDLKGALEGDTLWLQAVGARADSTYLGFGTSVLSRHLAVAVVDAVTTPTGQAKPTLGGSALAAWSHALDDDWTLALFASYAELRPARPAGLRPYVKPLRELRIGSNLSFTPVEKLTVSGEVQWVSLATRSRLVPTLTADPPMRRDGTWLMTLQVVRDF